jgi:hypothetical protein
MVENLICSMITNAKAKSPLTLTSSNNNYSSLKLKKVRFKKGKLGRDFHMRLSNRSSIRIFFFFFFRRAMGLANDESEVYTGIEDGRRTKFFHTRFRILELACAILSFLGMLLSVIQVKSFFNKKYKIFLLILKLHL